MFKAFREVLQEMLLIVMCGQQRSVWKRSGTPRHEDGIVLGNSFVLVYVTSYWEWLQKVVSSLLKDSDLQAPFVETVF